MTYSGPSVKPEVDAYINTIDEEQIRATIEPCLKTMFAHQGGRGECLSITYDVNRTRPYNAQVEILMRYDPKLYEGPHDEAVQDMAEKLQKGFRDAQQLRGGLTQGKPGHVSDPENLGNGTMRITLRHVDAAHLVTGINKALEIDGLPTIDSELMHFRG